MYDALRAANFYARAKQKQMSVLMFKNENKKKERSVFDQVRRREEKKRYEQKRLSSKKPPNVRLRRGAARARLICLRRKNRAAITSGS